MNVKFGEVEAENNPVLWRLRIDIGKQTAQAVIDEIKAESGEDPTLKPVIWVPCDNEDAAEKVVSTLKNLPEVLKLEGDEKEEYESKMEGLVRPDFKRNGSTVVATREDSLEEFVPMDMINEMVGPCQDLIDNSAQSIEVCLQSDMNGGEALSDDRNFEFELFKNARFNFSFKFDKNLIFKVMETAAGNLGQDAMFEQFKDAIEVASQMLVHYKMDLEFRSSDDIPPNVQKLFKKNLPKEMRLKKMLVPSDLSEKEKEIAGSVFGVMSGVKGPVNVGVAIGDWATVRITANLTNTFGVWKELVLKGGSGNDSD